MLINGVTAVASLVQAGLVGSFDDDMIEYETVGGRGQLRVFRAVSDGVLFLGWNKVLAGAIAREGRRRLTEWVEESLQEQVSDQSSTAEVGPHV